MRVDVEALAHGAESLVLQAVIFSMEQVQLHLLALGAVLAVSFVIGLRDDLRATIRKDAGLESD